MRYKIHELKFGHKIAVYMFISKSLTIVVFSLYSYILFTYS